MRFLKACYAHIVYKQPVNWVAEALSRQKKRTDRKQRNPQKLGPITTRAQVVGLCNIIKDLALRSGTGFPAESAEALRLAEANAATANVDVALAKVDAAATEVEEMSTKLQLAYELASANDKDVELEE